MKKAKQCFDLLNHNDKWGAKSPEQEQIIALEAQLKDLKLSKKLLDKLKGKDKDKDKDNAQTKQKESKGDKQNQAKNKKNTANKRFQKQDEEWKKTPPKEGEPWIKQVGKKTWYWCIHHMKWCVHKPEPARQTGTGRRT
jgi:cobalamin-dependent methionine synthase I